MKRSLSVFLMILTVFMCVVLFAACGNTEKSTESATEKPTESVTEKPTESVTEKPTESETNHVHAFGDWAVVREATCTEDGSEERVCACGEKETRKIDAKGHTEVVDEAAEATCTEAGKTEGKHCSVCGEVLVKQETVPAKGHTFGDWVSTKNACAEDGEETRACLVCGEKETRTVPAKGHTYDSYVKDADGKVFSVCSACGDRRELSADELRKAIYDSLPDFVQEVVAYGCPNADREEDYQTILRAMKEAGITATVSGTQGYGTGQLSDFLEACDEAGMGVYVDLFGMPAEEMVFKLDNYAYGYNCIRGVYLKDEPVPAMFPGLAEAKRRIMEEVEDYNDGWRIGANLLPYGDGAYESNGGWYHTLVEYAELVKPDFICFDRYPWDSNDVNGSTPQYYVANLLVAKKAADQYNLPLFTYLQSTAVGGHLEPSEAQFRCEANLSLACGADAFFLFTVYEGHGFKGFISGDGTGQKSEMYYVVQDVMKEINAMKGIYDLFDLDKVMTVGCDEYKEALREFSEAEDYLTDSYGSLASVTVEEGAKCFIGCMKDDDGREGFYIVNNEFATDTYLEYTLNFTEETTYQIWSMDGLVEIGTASSVSIFLMSGEGQFIVVGGENVPLGTTDIAD